MTDDTDADELRRYEEERQARARRRDTISRRIVGTVMAAAMALLAYDSAAAALAAREDGRPWGYPAALAVGCVAVIIVLAKRALGR